MKCEKMLEVRKSIFCVVVLLCEIFSRRCGDCNFRPNGGGVGRHERDKEGRCFLGDFYSPMSILRVPTAAVCTCRLRVVSPKNSVKYSQRYRRRRRRCQRGSFALDGMPACHPWLTCDDFAAGRIVLDGPIASGAVKQVSMAFWKGHALAVSTPRTVNNGGNAFMVHPEDFHEGLSMHLELINPFGHLVTFVGYCLDPLVIMTEFHQYGDATNVESALRYELSSLEARFDLCMDYAAILQWLHEDPSGPRVMCDSSSLNKTLEQYLITDDLRLVLNDLDALPQVHHGRPVVCGHRELTGSFVAPEQRWPYGEAGERPYDEGEMVGYDHRSDIWKVPDVCEYFLGGFTGYEILFYRLFSLYARCKSVAPDGRPSAAEILKAYKDVAKELFT